MKLTIPAWAAFEYAEVWKITEYRDGAIYKTKNTGKHIPAKRASQLPANYTAVSISTKQEQKEIVLDILTNEELKELV